MEDEKEYQHESYGMIGYGRINFVGTGPHANLFGSSIRHGNAICIEIKRASMKRHLAQEWYHGEDLIVRLEMSAEQFAQFITLPNHGDGVPCTLRSVEGEQMDPPPYYGMNEQFKAELKKDIREILEYADNLMGQVDGIIAKDYLSKKDKNRLRHTMEMLKQHMESNMPFLHRQYAKAMDKTMTAAKIEIEEFYNQYVLRAGRAALEAGIVPEQPQIKE